MLATRPVDCTVCWCVWHVRYAAVPHALPQQHSEQVSVVHGSHITTVSCPVGTVFQLFSVTVYFLCCQFSEFCKSKDASHNVIELLSWHKFIIQRRILAAIIEDNPSICREGYRSARYDISRAGIVLARSYSKTIWCPRWWKSHDWFIT